MAVKSVMYAGRPCQVCGIMNMTGRACFGIVLEIVVDLVGGKEGPSENRIKIAMMMILALLEIPVLNHVPILLIIENGLNMEKASLEICRIYYSCASYSNSA